MNDEDHARRDPHIRRGRDDGPDSSALYSSLMLPVIRGLPFSLRAGLRQSGRLFTSRPPPIVKSPATLNHFRQFSSTRSRNARYVRFEVDPEQPLNYRRWSTGTQVLGGIVVLSAAYYVAQYAMLSLRGASHSHAFIVLRLYQKPVGGDSWTSVQNSRPRCAQNTG